MAEQTGERTMAPGRTWWSRAILIGSVVAAALLPIGALGTRVGAWHFQIGLLLVAVGMALAAIGLVVGVAGIIAATRRRRAADKPAVYLGTLVSLLVLSVMGLQFVTGLSVPPIHNISTDVVDPPAFDKIVMLRGEGSNPLEYVADDLAALQRESYPWVTTLESPIAPAESLRRAAEVLKAMGLEIVHVDEQAGTVEATDTTFWFGFKDDLVVRVRPAALEAGSLVDVRSVSRVGVSDLGANARRIGKFLERFQQP